MNASTAIAHLAATMNPAIPVEWPGEQARDSVSQRMASVTHFGKIVIDLS
jgi:hypothetical protein